MVKGERLRLKFDAFELDEHDARLTAASNLLGTAAAYRGDQPAGRRWLEQALQAFREHTDRMTNVVFVVDMGVALYARLSPPRFGPIGT